MSKSPSLRRIQADIRELTLDPSDRYHATPLENDMFEWHFTIRGADGTDFEGGIYHGRILLPPDYPFKPPHIMFLTPSGRFETGTKICLSFSAYHPELWQPAWGIRLILEALISFLPTPADGAIGSLNWSSEERKKLAKKSQAFECKYCGKVADLLPKLKPTNGCSNKCNRFQKEIEQLQIFQQLEHKKEMHDGEETNNGNYTAQKSWPRLKGEEGIESDLKGNETSKTLLHTTQLINTTEHESLPYQETERDILPQLQLSDMNSGNNDSRVMESADLLFINANSTASTSSISSTIEDAPPQFIDGIYVRNVVPQPQQQEQTSLWDPILQITVILLSAICYLLARKVQGIWEELQSLDIQ